MNIFFNGTFHNFQYAAVMSEVDDLVGTGLETINDNSARWTLPILLGGRFRF